MAPPIIGGGGGGGGGGGICPKCPILDPPLISLLCSRYHNENAQSLGIKNCTKITSAIKVATIKNTDYFRYKGKPSHATAKLTPLLSAKMNGTQRKALVGIGVPMWVFGMYRYPILMPPKEANNQ